MSDEAMTAQARRLWMALGCAALGAYFLLFSAGGVLLGGIIADRTPHHERVAAVGFACTAAMAILMAWVNMPAAILIGVMSLGGLLNGIIQPSRDMMVRAVTPPGSFGKVFGFVTTGFNLGGMISPLLYGWLMDRGEPRMVFLVVTIFILLALFTAITRRPSSHMNWIASVNWISLRLSGFTRRIMSKITGEKM